MRSNASGRSKALARSFRTRAKPIMVSAPGFDRVCSATKLAQIAQTCLCCSTHPAFLSRHIRKVLRHKGDRNRSRLRARHRPDTAVHAAAIHQRRLPSLTFRLRRLCRMGRAITRSSLTRYRETHRHQQGNWGPPIPGPSPNSSLHDRNAPPTTQAGLLG